MVTRLKSLFLIQGYGLFVICMTLLGIGISITYPYLALYLTEDVGMSAGLFGIFMAVSSLSGVAVNTFIAKRSDNGLDRRWIIIIAMLSSALAFASYLMINNPYVLMAAVAIFNGLGAAAMPQIFAYAQQSADASETDDKTFAMSTLRSLFSLGFLIGPLCGTIILTSMGYKGLFAGTLIIYIVCASIVFFFLQKRQSAPKQSGKAKNDNISVFKNKNIRMPFIAFIILFIVSAINGLNTPLFIVNEIKGTHTDVGLVASICAGLEIPIMLALGALSRKISNHTLMMVGCFVALIYYSFLSVSTDSWQVIAAQLLQAGFVAIVMGNGLSYFTDLLPKSPGYSATLYSNSSTIGMLLGNLIGGMLAQFVGFRYVNVVTLVILVFAFILLWKIRPSENSSINTENSNAI